MKRAALALAVLLLAAPAAASTALAATVEELARESDAVVRGTVERQRSLLSPDGKRVYTFVEVRVAAAWKGTAPERVVVVTPGGVVGDLGQKVFGAAAFVDGEEVALFLKRDSEGNHRVSGLSQGKFSVVGGVARNDTRGFKLLYRQPGPGDRLAEEMPVDELERRVRGVR